MGVKGTVRHFLAAALLVTPALAAGSSPGDVSVSRRSDGLFAVDVTRPTERKAVLSALCEAALADCTLPPEVPGVVGPLTLQGSWGDVADGLLRGSGFGFATGGVSSGFAARLVLVVSDERASEGPRPAATSGEYTTAASVLDPPAFEDRTLDHAQLPEDIASAVSETAPRASVIIGGAGGVPPGTTLVATPFSNADGSPLLSMPPPPVTGAREPMATPYSHPDGSPLLVAPASGPSELTPFSDPEGAPIPVPPQAAPGADPGNPFPTARHR